MLLRKGSEGDDVKKLQSKLGLNVDGDFGPETEAAVIKYQKENGLTPDGLVGNGTWSKLFTVISEESNIKLDIIKLKGHIPQEVYDQIPIACEKFNITNALRLAHFLGQCDHESGHFKAVSENLNYSESGLS